jgi:two-component system phosphate regulon sensor histidine kinase PhoR
MEMEILEPKRRNLKVNSAPYLNARSDQIGVVLIFSDITRLKKLEQHRIEFVANVSHELKTPLTSIQGYAETLLNPKMQSVPEKQIEFAEKIKDNSIRLRTMVEDLLYLANLDQHQGSSEEFKVREGDLSFQVKRAMEYLKAKAVSSSKSLVFEPNVEAKVRINEGLFMQALVNIIDNAIKYSGDSEKIWIKSFTNDEQKICLEIRDEGIGISKEDIGRLFERFYRVDKDRSRNTGGSGLGLAIVKNILDLHQIELKVESELGIGTRFGLIFPT